MSYTVGVLEGSDYPLWTPVFTTGIAPLLSFVGGGGFLHHVSFILHCLFFSLDMGIYWLKN
jgi:hypothetical protein